MSIYSRKKNISYVSKRAIHSYFHPFKEMYALFRGDENFLYDQKLYKHEIIQRALTVINKAICFNQGELIQYTYVAAERHKQLKDEYREKKPNKQKIVNYVERLLSYLNGKFFEIASENFQYLQIYFEGRSSIPPRICIKGNFKIDNRNTVVSVFRDSEIFYQSDCEIEKNSGFFSILNNGRFYLNNDIPSSFFKGAYINPRLDQDKLDRFKKTHKHYYKTITKMPLIRDEFIDWASWWKDCKQISDERSYYKSTLIIPMTLINNKLSEEFKSKVNIEDVEKVIFGFLCFDHVDRNFFNPDIDIPIGYIFADLLSIYLFNKLVYTEISETFRKIESLLESDNYEKLLKEVSCIRDSLVEYKIKYSDLLSEIQESTVNQLYSIDDFLLRCTTITSKFNKGIEQGAAPDRYSDGAS